MVRRLRVLSVSPCYLSDSYVIGLECSMFVRRGPHSVLQIRNNLGDMHLSEKSNLPYQS
jgi:hypothetical protein